MNGVGSLSYLWTLSGNKQNYLCFNCVEENRWFAIIYSTLLQPGPVIRVAGTISISEAIDENPSE